MSSKSFAKPALVLGLGAAIAAYYFRDQLRPAAREIKPALQGDWVNLKLANVEPLTHNTKRFTFNFPEHDQPSGLETASCILTKVPKSDGKFAIRPYTPVSDPDLKGKLDLIIKKYDGGVASSHIFDMKPNDELSFKGPILKYKWEANKHNEIVLLGAGTGITPLYQLIHAITSNAADNTKVTLIYGNTTPDDIILKKEIDNIAANFPQQFKVHYFVDKANSEWKGNTGFVTKKFLSDSIPPATAENVKAFVCGPPGFYQALSGNKIGPADQGELSGALKELGYTKDQVFKF